MDLGMSNKVKPLVEKVRAMVREEIMPLEAEYEAEIGKDGNRWAHTKRQTEIIEGLKAKARERGLWNFWLTGSDKGYGLTTVEYAYLAEEMGWSRLAPETFNCMAPDTGNMEVLERYGSPEHKEKWLKPLLEGKIRSAYIMTEPGVASSDATNLAMDAKLEGDEWVLNGEKWFASGAGDPRCKIYIVMVCTDPDVADKHKRHSQILVPAGTKGVEVLRGMKVYGDDDAPHGHMHLRFTDVRVPKENLVLGPRPRLRGGAGPAGAGPHPSLHARHRQCRAGAGADVPPLAVARGVRQAAGPARRQLRHHRREPHEDRDGAPAVPEGRLHDGHGRPARGRALDLADQGRSRRASRWRSPTRPCRCTAPWASRRTRRWRTCGRTCARCASPTAPTPCTAARSPAPSCAAIRTRRSR